MRVFSGPDTPIPEVQLLSNGRYHVMITNAGGGVQPLEGSRRHALARRQHLRQLGHVLLSPRRNQRGGVVHRISTDTQTLREYQAIFSEARAEFRRRDHDWETHTEIAVSPEDDVELRRIRIANRSRTRRTIEVTSYAEVVLASSAADALHPAFGNLFVQTEILPERQAILCTRRPRSLGRAGAVDVSSPGRARGRPRRDLLESDRARFIGRGHTTVDPQALGDGAPAFE